MRVPRPATLRGRVAAGAVVVLAAWVVVLVIGVNVVLGARLAAQADDALQAKAQAAASTVQVGIDGNLLIRDGADDSAVDIGTWIFQGDQLLEEPAGGSALRPVAQGLTGRGRALHTTDGSAGNRWYAEPVLRDGVQVGTVVTVLSLAPYGGAEQVVRWATITLGTFLLIGAWLALRAGVGVALRPVEVMTGQAARWSSGDIERRFGPARRPAELDALAVTLDAVLDRLAAVLRRERDLSAEISHELRTPLARLRADLDLLDAREDMPAAAHMVVRQLSADADELTGIVNTVLAAAREPRAMVGRCDVEDVVRSLTTHRQPPPVIQRGDGSVVAGVTREIVQRTLTPVLDNAFRYASTAVTIEIRGSRGQVHILIADDGPGLQGIDAAAVFDPGRRGDPHGGHPGAGLGLSLVHRLVTAADGTVSVTSTPHGAVFVVSWPAG